MSDVILDQFNRLLDGLGSDDPWPQLVDSGFLDLLRDEAEGGAGLALDDLFPLAVAAGGRIGVPPVIETMAARLVAPDAIDLGNAEEALKGGGVKGEIALALAAALAAAQMTGAMEQLQAMTVDYAATRSQFGRPIGKFQAVQHQIAVMAEEAMASRMAAEAAFTGAPLEISPLRAGAAKLRAGQAAQAVAAIAHAVHGAIAISQEFPLHRLTRKLHLLRLVHGGESYWARRLGRWALSGTGGFAALARSL